ncbi:hypothetical protein J0H58_34185 [bacterium]|nr:hypothetical protein [bacterium]
MVDDRRAGRELDHVVLEHAVVHPVAAGVALEDLLAGVEEAVVVRPDALRALPALEVERVVVHLTDGEVGDEHVLRVVDRDAERDRGVVHPGAADHHVVEVVGGAADGHVLDRRVLADVQRPREPIFTRADDDRLAGTKVLNGGLEFRLGGHPNGVWAGGGRRAEARGVPGRPRQPTGLQQLRAEPSGVRHRWSFRATGGRERRVRGAEKSAARRARCQPRENSRIR